MTDPTDLKPFRIALSDSASFLERVRSIKRALDVDFEWYPYDTLSNLSHMSDLLSTLDGDLVDYLPNSVALDIGCGDGEVALFLESCGFSVEAIDFVHTNHNGLRGARRLIGALGSMVRLHNLDLDTGIEFPVGDAGLAVCLGLLYHLKNPHAFLERLARSCHYCILSTKLLTSLQNAPSSLDSLPIGYLVDSAELNDDDSNYWVFTESGLARLLDRAGWVVLATSTLESPVRVFDKSPFRVDKRAFMVLCSKVGLRSVRLLNGWYGVDGSGWRWTAPTFSFLIPAPASPSRIICLDTYIPSGIYNCAALTTTIDGEPAQAQVLDMTEFSTIRIPVPATLGGRTSLSVECTLSHPVRMEPDKRELGLLIGALYCSEG